MPLIMDDEPYMDDLFGDDEPVPMVPSAPPIKGLAQVVDEMQETNCCQYVVSRQFLMTVY